MLIPMQVPAYYRERAARRAAGATRRAGQPPDRVLLAEDDAAFRRLLALVLRQDGFEVAEVADGRALVEHVAALQQASEPGAAPGGRLLVVSDIRMPRLDGLQALAGLRQADWPLPTVLMTAFADCDTRVEAARLGASALLCKPFPLGHLRLLARQLAGRS